MSNVGLSDQTLPQPHPWTVEQLRTFVQTHIRYKNWVFHIDQTNDVPYLQVQFVGRCAVTGTLGWQKCRKWQLSPHMTPSELVGTAWLAVQQAELHEALEAFRYKGVAIYNPHRDCESLVALAGQEDRRP